MSDTSSPLPDPNNPGNVPVQELVRIAKYGRNPKESSLWQTILLLFVVGFGSAFLWYLWKGGEPLPVVSLEDQDLFGQKYVAAPAKELTLKDIPFDGEQAMTYLKEICAIGRRVSNSEGMTKQREYLKKHFTDLGATVTLQEFPARDPLTGNAVTLGNMIVTWHPDRKERILFCAHYDTRPFPDQDPHNKEGLFVGANDGASGIAVMMELGKQLPQFKSKLGVDFVFFDAEEWVFSDKTDKYFLGSEHFAKEYAAKPPGHKYKWGILLDMVAGKALDLPVDHLSWKWPDTQPLVKDIWLVARKLGVTEFRAQLARTEVRDDHIPLHDIGRISCIDIIDFNYPFWHTTKDVPENCSALSMAKVGWVLQEWLKQQ
jgi:hypothetical protein